MREKYGRIFGRHPEGATRRISSKNHKDSSLALRMTKRGAFTLAEVLIVLAIIGVISVLTLPNVMQSYNKKVTVAQLQRTYNALRNGFTQYMSDQKADDLSSTPLTSEEANIVEFMKKYLNSTKICAGEVGSTVVDCKDDGRCASEDVYVSKNAGSCLASSYKGLMSNETVSDFNVDVSSSLLNKLGECKKNSYGQTECEQIQYGLGFPCALLESGASVCTNGSTVRIDTNGLAAPNRLGIDLFEFAIDNTGKADILSVSADNCKKSGTAEKDQPVYCFAKIVQDGWVMNY